MSEVKWMMPTVQTELIREKEAMGRWRLWNGVAWVHAYEDRERAIEVAKRLGVKAIAFYEGDDHRAGARYIRRMRVR